MLFDEQFVLVAGVVLEHAADDDALPLKLRGEWRVERGECKLQTIATQPLHYLTVLLVLEIADDARGHHLADALDLLQLVHAGIHQGIHRLEMTGQEAGTGLADEADAKGEDHALEGYLLRFLDGIDDVLGRLCTRAVAVDLLHVDVVEVGHVMDESLPVVVLYELRPQADDVHRLTGNEMLDATLDLRRTTSIVGTIPGSLTLIAHQRGATLRTTLDERDRQCYDRPLVDIDTHNLGDDLATLFHEDSIADM